MKTRQCIMVFTISLAASASSLVHAEKWVKTYGNEIAVEYVDIDTIKRDGTNVSASFKRDYIDGVVRGSSDEAGKFFQFNQSRSVLTFECAGERKSIDQLWDVSTDKKKRSPSKSYPLSKSNDTWDAAAKTIVCK